MRVTYLLLLLGATPQAIACSDLLDVSKRPLAGGEPVNFCEAYKGKVLLVVNTASKCAFTGQYEGLEKLYSDYKDRGLVVLGFPSNDFANQEPGTEQEIKTFCRMTYGVQFPMFEKSQVTERNAGPFYQKLGKSAGEFPSWNFHKYIIDREGKLIGSYGSFTGPQSKKIIKQIEAAL